MKPLATALLTAIFLSGCSLLGQRPGEEALYATLEIENNFEVRMYEPLIIAQAATEGPYLMATRASYNKLTAYVSGNNQARQTISVNPPITVADGAKAPRIELTLPYYEENVNGVWLTSVALPEVYSLATLPKPVDDSITFKVLPRLKVAVIKFQGYRSENLITRKAEALDTWARQKNLKPSSAARSVIYDSPWAIPMIRRHEVHINVE